MCYEIVSATRAKLKYAQHRTTDTQAIKDIETELKELEKDLEPFYHITGFAFPKVMVYKAENPLQPLAIQWGLIPHWAKSKADAQAMQVRNLNARIESLAEKPTFKTIVSNKCLVIIDGFFEHKLVGKNKYPHLISNAHDEPLSLAALWDNWQNPNMPSEIIETVTIITAPANEFMAKIHNNAKMGEARMPLLINTSQQDEWLHCTQIGKLPHLIKDAHKQALKAHTVQKLSGKRTLGNTPKAIEPHTYPELSIQQGTLF